MNPLIATLCLLISVPAVALFATALGAWLADRRGGTQPTLKTPIGPAAAGSRPTFIIELKGAPDADDYGDFLRQVTLYRSWASAGANVTPEGRGTDIDKFEEDFHAYLEGLGGTPVGRPQSETAPREGGRSTDISQEE